MSYHDAREWLHHHAGISWDLVGKERNEAMRKYREKLKTMPRVVDTEPRLWAAKILSRIADGEILPELVERYAKLSFDCGGSDE